MQTESKEAIDTLELWLRNIIDKMLTAKYGKNYFLAKNDSGQNIIKSSIQKSIENRFNGQEDRFSRKVDALLLEEEANIICNPNLYKEFFKPVFGNSFPAGNEMLRSIFNQLIPIRNKLFHSNNISEREYEKVICYSHDIIDSVKIYNKLENMDKEYNVPSIVSFQDSLGNKVYASQFNRIRPSTPFCHFDLLKNHILYPNEKLTLEVNIDESFSQEKYEVSWIYKTSGDMMSLKTIIGEKISIKIEEKNIQEKFQIECYVKSNKVWHRFGSKDDMLRLFYKVLPIA